MTGKQESHDRFWAETGWKPYDLGGKVLLDVGCGAGRFAEVALEAGARVIAVDLSKAVYACQRTLARFPKENYVVLRADLFALPLNPGVFDGIYSLGVLHHTPDPLRAIRTLSHFLKPGGRLATWIYERRAVNYRILQPRTWIRMAVIDWSVESKIRLSKTLTAMFFPVGWTLSWLGRTGERIAHFLPYAARHHLARGDVARQWAYSVMDTLDWYGPAYEVPQCALDVIRAMRDAGLVNVRRLSTRGMAIIGERMTADKHPSDYA